MSVGLYCSKQLFIYMLVLGFGFALIACTGSKASKLPVITDIDLQKQIFKAVEEHWPVLELPRGRYVLNRPLLIDRATDLTIEGNGSLLVYTIADNPKLPPTFATTIQNCRNLTIRNLTVDFDPLPFTQGTLINMSPDGTWYDVRIHKGYRSDVSFFAFDVDRREFSLHLFDPETGLLKVGSSFFFPNRVTSPENGVFRFWFEHDPDPERRHIKIGDDVATAGWRAMAFAIRNSEGTKLENVTIWASGGAAISEIGGGGGSDLQINLVPGPRPQGADKNRLWSASRDGYHACCMRRGPTIHDSQFISLGDDAINVFSPIYQVIDVYTNVNKIQVAALDDGSSPVLQPGDEVIIYEPSRVIEKARSRVVNTAPGGQITLEATTGIEKKDLVFFPDFGGRGTVIRDSVFRNNDAGGITVKSHDAVIENNIVEHMAISGIELGVYLNYYYEGPFAANTIIRNNTVQDVGFSALVLDGDWRLNGAITVGMAQIGARSMLDGNRGFRNILIENNTIDKTANVGIFISNATDVIVRNNRISNTYQYPLPRSTNWWDVPMRSAIYVIESDNVTLENNLVSQIGQYGDKPVEIHPSCNNVVIVEQQ